MPKPLPQRRETCSARTVTGPCTAPSGHGTGHLGFGCCLSHGGGMTSHVGAAYAAHVMERLDRQFDRGRHEGRTVTFGQPDPEAMQIIEETLDEHISRRPTPYGP